MANHVAQKVSEHLRKGGHIPHPICPFYQYDKSISKFLPIATLQKQPRTLKYSMNFEYQYQLESEFPDLKLAALDTNKKNTQFSDSMSFECENKSDMITPFNLHETVRLFQPLRWKFGGHAYQINEVPSAADMKMSDTFGEVCLCGESNTGKSSLVNTLMGSADFHQGLALVSKRPGRTRMMNFYTIPFHFSLVDLMGYGFALGIETKIREYWLKFMKTYFVKRMEQHLKHIFVLIDTDRFVRESELLSERDYEMFEFLDDCYVPYSIILTKIDCVNDGNYTMHDNGTKVYNRNVNDVTQFNAMLDELEKVFEKYCMIQPFVNVTSARLGFGVTELQCTMSRLCQLSEKSEKSLIDIDISQIIDKALEKSGNSNKKSLKK